ncbi:F0F1 ATP synthase subunit epsilon [Sulfurospirillum sp. T05]|uniref:ATP synthase epsilon chain n=1 Tax=Sulfurospirillum tamanense TaxID=2813362 RepID=A0ABS2WPR7_9BACT|nr:ATP synthase F1 subunit epsilon [Sulfurospirillum tamanensis]MBN2963691.1 F0F1 ATP synthase subunit epsilon [Sulfurospirillum tamanensis]
MSTLKLEVVTPLGLIFSHDVKAVTLPGVEGEFGILPGHASFVSMLKAGVMDIELESGKHDVVAVNWGYVKVDEEKVIVLADGAVSVRGSNESEIAASIENANKLIESMGDSETSIALAKARIESIARLR